MIDDPVMKAMAHGGSALGADSAWIPVVKGWTSSRDFDVIAPERFRTWFAQRKAAQPDEEPKGGDA